MTATTFAPGALVTARGREWVVLPDSEPDLLILRPLGGGDDDIAAVFPALETVAAATFPAPTANDLGDSGSAALLRTALRIGFRSSAGPFRSLANLAFEPRAYQFVPLLLALRHETVRLLIADDVGIGKTIEAGMIASELIAQGEVSRLAVLCSPALAQQWQDELRLKFGIDAELVLPSTVTRLARGLMLNESLFQKYPFVVVSTDFIKSHTRRQEFINHCPELVIVDEAHNAVADGTRVGSRTQRYELLQAVAADPTRHLVLVTATPHSGKEEGFTNLLGLLDPQLPGLDLDSPRGRERLARHFVQRRRGDIRRFIDEETAFPRDRETKESPYGLSAAYASAFEQVLDYAREQVSDDSGGVLRQRVRWWAALALLRALASSPRAAVATLRTRAKAAAAADAAEADELGRASVLDTADDDVFEAIDTTPGADIDNPDDDLQAAAGQELLNHRRRLLALARKVEELEGQANDAKLARLAKDVKGLLAEGYDPIVFCRFIDTAEYVAEHLAGKLGSGVHIAAVTGNLPPTERIDRIAQLTVQPGRHVLIATDCLSEGVNLQEHFQAVVHYDLAWNPTRHEQREGRVDRFGQRADVVRAVTIYGRDNGIDGIVLDVLLRKHRAIRTATGVSVPVPNETDSVVEALMEGLVLRGRRDANQLTLDLGLAERTDALHSAWESAAERERRSRTKYAQDAIHPDEVAREVAAAREALGTHDDVATFTRNALAANGASIATIDGGFSATTVSLPIGLRDNLPVRRCEPLAFRRDLPVERGEALLARTDAHVEAVARFVLDTALDSSGDHRVAARAGVMRTTAVSLRTTLLIVRFRFHLDLPGRQGIRSVVAEDVRLLAFTGAPDQATWLDDTAAESLLVATPDANLPSDLATNAFNRVSSRLDALTPGLDAEADRLADQLLDSHRRVRSETGTGRRGLTVTAQKPADILGCYVFLPVGQ